MNPLLQSHNLEFDLPPFSKIKAEHYLPAIENRIEQERAAIDEIANNPDAATFENTLVALENAQRELQTLALLFSNLNHSNSTEGMRKAQREIAPKLSAHNDSVTLNAKLFARIDDVYRGERKALSGEDVKLLEETHKMFVRGGALLKGAQRERLQKINAELSELAVSFTQNLVQENTGFALILDESDLDGLPDDVKARAASLATSRNHEGKYCFIPERSSFTPFLTHSTRRDLREALYQAYLLRGDNNNAHNNNDICKRTTSLRRELAELLGYPSFAHFRLDDTMAKTPERVHELLEPLFEAAKKRALSERDDMQALVEEEGHNFKLQGHDWWHYAEKVRQKKYALDDESLKPYFSLERVFQGVLDVSARLFNLSFQEIEGLEKYHEDVRHFEVKDAAGEHVALFMTDYYQREGKNAGAWMSNFIDQEEGVRPIVVNVCNFPKGAAGKPALLSLEQVRTLFHEFGHALHGMLSKVKYRSLSGTAVTRDFVEFPSQILEHWAFDDDVIDTYASHYETGEAISTALKKRIKEASTFNEGFASTEYLAAALLDMRWHLLTEESALSTSEFEQEVMRDLGTPEEIAPRYRSVNFAHIFSGPGYAAGYYSYIWSAVLDCDGFSAFKEKGVFNEELAMRYRKNILEQGNTGDLMEAFVAFRGREPKIDALLENRGLG